MRRRILIAATACFAVAGGQTAWGQIDAPRSGIGVPRTGFHLQSVSFETEYLSSGIDTPGTVAFLPGMRSDVQIGGSAAAGWSHSREKWQASLMYSISYLARLRYSEWNGFNHFLSISISRKLGRQWSAHLSGSGAVSTTAQWGFTSNPYAQALFVPSTFDELAAAVLTGQTSNAQIAAALTGSPAQFSSAAAIFYGRRFFNAAAQAGVTYSHSPRTTVTLTASGSRFEHLSDSGSGSGIGYAVPRTMALTAGAQISHSLSPQTTVSVTTTAGRIFSAVQNSYTKTISAGWGRRMGARWFTGAQGGIAQTTTLDHKTGFNDAPQYVGGGSLGYTYGSHVFLGSFNVSAIDIYGLGARTMRSSGGGWHWRRPGLRWGLSADGDWQQFAAGEANAAGAASWRARAGVTRQLSRTTVASTEYVYFSGAVPGMAYQYSAHAVQLMLTIAPLADTSRN